MQSWLPKQPEKVKYMVQYLHEYAFNVVTEASNRLSAIKQIELHFSSGRYCLFKQRNGLERRHGFAEYGSINIVTTFGMLPSLDFSMVNRTGGRC